MIIRYSHDPRRRIGPMRQAGRTIATSTIAGTLAAIVIATFLVFAPGLDNKPVAEDYMNPREFTQLGDDRQFRPVFAAVEMGIQGLWGPHAEQPLPYHGLSLFLHVATIVAVTTFALEISRDFRIAAISGLVFALYPRHHEVVLWPAASLHSLMTLSLVLSLTCFVRAERSSRSSLWRVGAAVLYAIALPSSEGALAGPLLALLLYFAFFATSGSPWRTRIRAALHSTWPYFAIVAVYTLILVAGSSSASRLVSREDDTTFYHLRVGPGVILDLVGYLVYAVIPIIPLRSLDAVLPKIALTVVVLFILAGVALRGTRLMKIGIAWILLSVLPYALLVPFGNADRYFYLASVGFALFLATLLVSSISLAPRAHHANGAVAIVACAALVLYVAVSAVSLNRRAAEWEEAGNLAASLVDDAELASVSSPGAEQIYVVNLPRTLGQARVFGYGFSQAVEYRLKEQAPAILTVWDPTLTQTLSPYDAQTHSPSMILVYEAGHLVDHSAGMSDASIYERLVTLSGQPPAAGKPAQ